MATDVETPPQQGAVRVTLLQRHPEGGWWTANVTTDGHTVAVDCRYGSWQALVRPYPGARKLVRREVMPRIAQELAQRARRAERAEARA